MQLSTPNMRSVIFIFHLIPFNTIFCHQSRMCTAHLTNLPTSQLLFKEKEGVEDGADTKDTSIVKCKVQKAMYIDDVSRLL